MIFTEVPRQTPVGGGYWAIQDSRLLFLSHQKN